MKKLKLKHSRTMEVKSIFVDDRTSSAENWVLVSPGGTTTCAGCTCTSCCCTA